MECPLCGSYRSEEGRLTTPYGFTFKASSSKFMSPKESTVSARVCLDCGRLFDFKVDKIEKFNK